MIATVNFVLQNIHHLGEGKRRGGNLKTDRVQHTRYKLINNKRTFKGLRIKIDENITRALVIIICN